MILANRPTDRKSDFLRPLGGGKEGTVLETDEGLGTGNEDDRLCVGTITDEERFGLGFVFGFTERRYDKAVSAKSFA